ncbi:MAG: hypothetical protein ACQERF_08080 [Actinomycetota bacterium]
MPQVAPAGGPSAWPVAARQWLHHLEVRALADLDDDVVAWLREVYDRAG